VLCSLRFLRAGYLYIVRYLHDFMREFRVPLSSLVSPLAHG
jgi:hypothetical protein